MFGDGRPYLVALLTLDPDEAPQARRASSASTADPAAMAADERVRAAMQADVDAVNARFARIEQIKRFDDPRARPHQAEGELTPTLKVKRAGRAPSASPTASTRSTPTDFGFGGNPRARTGLSPDARPSGAPRWW